MAFHCFFQVNSFQYDCNISELKFSFVFFCVRRVVMRYLQTYPIAMQTDSVNVYWVCACADSFEWRINLFTKFKCLNVNRMLSGIHFPKCKQWGRKSTFRTRHYYNFQELFHMLHFSCAHKLSFFQSARSAHRTRTQCSGFDEWMHAWMWLTFKHRKNTEQAHTKEK